MTVGESQVKQTANIVSGDQAGRDINTTTYVYQGRPTPMARMIEKFRREASNDSAMSETIQLLQRWHKADGHVIGLEEKLEQGNRRDLIIFAMEAKERFSRSLVRHQYSPAAQEIYAFLLAKIYQIFVSIIYPEICRGVGMDKVDKLLVSEVYNQVEALLEDNPLQITPEEVMGMLYWLTGNCHLKWSKDANIQSSV